MVVPNSPNDMAAFGLSNTTELSISVDTQVNAINFTPGASGYTITANGGSVLTFSGFGVINDSAASQNFVAGVSGSRGGTIRFLANSSPGTSTTFTNAASTLGGGMTVFETGSSAGSANFLNHGGAGDGRPGGGTTLFWANASSASFTSHGGISAGATGGFATVWSSNVADSKFTNTSSSVPGAGGGRTEITHASTLANGTFHNHGSTVSGAGAGFTRFLDDSDAGQSVIVNYGGSNGGNGGSTTFSNFASANSATIIATGGSSSGRGGSIRFEGGSDGGNASIKVFGNGELDLSRSVHGTTIGSVEGDGNIFLGRGLLTIGSNNQSTTFAGVILDGGLHGGTGGSLTKIGTGTLVLSQPNSYTGNTTVNAGRLVANNSSGSATGSGAVTVNGANTVLAGAGAITGPVTVDAGAAISPGDASAATGVLTLANNLTMQANSLIELGLGPSGAHSTLKRSGGSWSFAANQAFAFINCGAHPGTYDNIITGLAGDPGNTASWAIVTPGFVGTFAYDGMGNIDLTITAAPPLATPSPSPTATPTPTPPATPTPTPSPTATPSATPACIANPVVRTNADSGPGSLRQAIIEACSRDDHYLRYGSSG